MWTREDFPLSCRFVAAVCHKDFARVGDLCLEVVGETKEALGGLAVKCKVLGAEKELGKTLYLAGEPTLMHVCVVGQNSCTETGEYGGHLDKIRRVSSLPPWSRPQSPPRRPPAPAGSSPDKPGTEDEAGVDGLSALAGRMGYKEKEKASQEVTKKDTKGGDGLEVARKKLAELHANRTTEEVLLLRAASRAAADRKDTQVRSRSTSSSRSRSRGERRRRSRRRSRRSGKSRRRRRGSESESTDGGLGHRLSRTAQESPGGCCAATSSR